MCTLVLSQLEPLAKTKTNKPPKNPHKHPSNTTIPITHGLATNWFLHILPPPPPKKRGWEVGNLFPQTHTSVSLPLYLPSSFVRSQGILLLISPNGTKISFESLFCWWLLKGMKLWFTGEINRQIPLPAQTAKGCSPIETSTTEGLLKIPLVQHNEIYMHTRLACQKERGILDFFG